MYFETDFFCESCKESKSGMFHLSVFLEKSLNRLVLVCFIFTCFLITMHEIDTVAEMYLKPFRTYMIEIFCENKQLLAHNLNKNSVIENWHGSK